MSHTKSRPYCLVVLGPTASGKGSLPDKVERYLKTQAGAGAPAGCPPVDLDLKSKPVPILVDDLVIKNPYYKKKIDEFLDSPENAGKIKDIFSAPTDSQLKYFNDAYFESRKTTDCIKGSPLHMSGRNCDTINDENLTNAFENGENIVFETTGTRMPWWLIDTFKDYIKKFNYKLIFAWTVVEFCELLERNKSRALAGVKNYLENRTKAADAGEESSAEPPRLPDIRVDHYLTNLSAIIDSFSTALQEKDKVLCKALGETFGCDCNIRLMIFNNDGAADVPVYDSDSADLHEHFARIGDYKLENATKCGGEPKRSSKTGGKMRKAGKKSRNSRRRKRRQSRLARKSRRCRSRRRR